MIYAGLVLVMGLLMMFKAIGNARQRRSSFAGYLWFGILLWFLGVMMFAAALNE